MIRGIRFSQIQNLNHRGRFSDLTFEGVGFNSSRILCAEEKKDDILPIWEECEYHLSINLGGW
jgi:hypothetical protein